MSSEFALSAEAALLALTTGFACALCATPVLSGVARRIGLLDPARRAPRLARKLQRRPVALVGGAAVLLGVLVGGGVPLGGWSHFGLEPPPAAAVVLALCAAFAAGFLDDVVARGLGPPLKLLLQLAAGVPLGVGLALTNGAQEPASLLAWGAVTALGSAVALNAVNTFDNADGAAAGLGALALVMPMPAAAGALAGFLPFNLDGDAVEGRRAAPTAYLGDSGSHLLGMLILLSPAAWPALCLPLLDLGRVALERAAAGEAPWRGDRRHLAHRLAARGLSRGAIVGLLTLVAAPALVLGSGGMLAGRPDMLPELLLGGVAGTLAGYALALRYATLRLRPSA